MEEDLVIGNVYAEDPDDWDVKDKHYYFLGPRNMAKYFRYACFPIKGALANSVDQNQMPQKLASD